MMQTKSTEPISLSGWPACGCLIIMILPIIFVGFLLGAIFVGAIAS